MMDVFITVNKYAKRIIYLYLYTLKGYCDSNTNGIGYNDGVDNSE